MPNIAPMHLWLGSFLALVVWILALIALFALPKRLVPLFTLLWGGLMLWLGMAQTGLLVGSSYLYGALGNLWGTRGRHPGCMLMAAALLLVAFAVGTSGG